MSKKKRPWDQSYSGKARRKTPPQRVSLEGHFTKLGDVYMRPPKLRRVFVTLEIQTERSLDDLRSSTWWLGRAGMKVLQASANVARPEKQ